MNVGTIRFTKMWDIRHYYSAYYTISHDLLLKMDLSVAEINAAVTQSAFFQFIHDRSTCDGCILASFYACTFQNH